MKYLYVTLRVVLAVLLLVPVLGLPYLHARNLRNLYGVLHEEPYLKISPDVVIPANEGRRVQLTVPAYTDEWLELPDIGVPGSAAGVGGRCLHEGTLLHGAAFAESQLLCPPSPAGCVLCSYGG